MILPHDKIVSNSKLCGYTMDYVKGKSIFELNLSKKQLIELFKKISSYLKYYHQYGIVLADFNLSNLLFTSSDSFYFVDIDSAKILNLPHDSIPTITYNFLKSCGYDVNKIVVDEHFDNLSLFLNFFYILFEGNPLYNLSVYEIEKYMETKEVDDQKPFVKELLHYQHQVPYFEQVFR